MAAHRIIIKGLPLAKRPPLTKRSPPAVFSERAFLRFRSMLFAPEYQFPEKIAIPHCGTMFNNNNLFFFVKHFFKFFYKIAASGYLIKRPSRSGQLVWHSDHPAIFLAPEMPTLFLNTLHLRHINILLPQLTRVLPSQKVPLINQQRWPALNSQAGQF